MDGLVEPSDFFPILPKFEHELLQDCEKDGDFRPILFEYYKYFGLLANAAARVSQKSTSLYKHPEMQFSTVKGLLNRIARLMLSNVKLSFEGNYGETTLIIDRCINESALKIMWLTGSFGTEALHRYLADGLKAELELKSEIELRIAARSGIILPIDERMLRGIANTVSAAGLNEIEIKNAKKSPPLPAIMKSLGKDDLQYTVTVRIGSHAVHGTWPSLLSHYLTKQEDGEFIPRDANCETNFVQFAVVTIGVAEAISQWAEWAFAGDAEKQSFTSRIEQALELTLKYFKMASDAKESRLI